MVAASAAALMFQFATVAPLPAAAAPVPTISSLSPSSGPVGTSITFSGSGFESPGTVTGTVYFTQGTTVDKVSGSGWSDTSATAVVPSGLTAGTVTAQIYNYTSGQLTNLETFSVTPTTLYVAPSGTPYTSIQAAVNAAWTTPGPVTIEVYGGNTFTGQVSVSQTGVGSGSGPAFTSLTISGGYGGGVTTVAAPSALVTNLNEGSTGYFFDDNTGATSAIIGVQLDSSTIPVTIQGLTVSGSALSSSGGPWSGIALVDTSGAITHNVVTNIQIQSQIGDASVHGIEVKATQNAATVAVTGNTLQDYPGHVAIDLMSNGTASAAGDLTVTVSGNKITGNPASTLGPVAQFGIVAGGIASLSISHNTISDMSSPWGVGGIWLDQMGTGATCTVSGNTLLNNDNGIDVHGASGCTLSGNTITAGSSGIELGQSYLTPTVVPSSNNTISGNMITGVITDGTSLAYGSPNPVSAIANQPVDGVLIWDGTGNTVQGNAVSGFVNDVYVGQDPVYLLNLPSWSGSGSSINGTFANSGNTVAFNNLGTLATPASGSGVTGYAVANLNNSTSFALNATENWWGSANGPTNAANTYNVGAQGLSVSSGVDFTPWLTSAPAVGATSGTTFAPVTDITSSAQFASIQAAVNAAVSGDTIQVAAGTFTEGVTINTPVTLEGAQHGVDARTRTGVPETVITANAAGSGGFGINASNVVIDGFTIATNAPTSALNNIAPNYGTGIDVAATVSGTQIINDIIQNNVFGVYLKSDGTYKTLVEHDLFNNNNQPGAASGNGIYTDGALSNAVIENNTFTANSSAGIVMAGSSAGLETGITIANNEFLGTTALGGTALALFNVTNSKITGNFVNGTGPTATDADAIYLGGGDSGITLSDNLIRNSAGWAIHLQTGYGPAPILANSSIVATLNSLGSSNTLGGLRVGSKAYTGTNINAADNWWGSVSGPGGTEVSGGSSTVKPWISTLALSSPILSLANNHPKVTETVTLTGSDKNAVKGPLTGLTVQFSGSGTSLCTQGSQTVPVSSTGTATYTCTAATTVPGFGKLTATLVVAGQLTTLNNTAQVISEGTPSAGRGPSSSATTPPPVVPPLGSLNASHDATTTTTNGASTLDVSGSKLGSALGSGTHENVAFTSSTDQATLNLPTTAVTDLGSSHSEVSLVTPAATYTLPVASLGLAALAKSLDVSQTALSLSVQVVPAPSSDTADIKSTTPTATVLASPVTFTVTATANGKTTTIATFTGRVPRTLNLSVTPNPLTSTGVIMVNGVPEHAWTLFSGNTATIESLTNSTYAVIQNQVSFSDISNLPQATQQAIEGLANKLILNGMGNGTFDPAGGVSRAQFAVMIAKALGLWHIPSNATFSDVAASYYAVQEISAVATEGYIKGFPGGTFQPDAPITNAQMAAIVARVLRGLGIQSGASSVTPKDGSSIPAWAANDVNLALSTSVMTLSSNGDFSPSAVTTRAQAAVIVWNLMQKAGIE